MTSIQLSGLLSKAFTDFMHQNDPLVRAGAAVLILIIAFFLSRASRNRLSQGLVRGGFQQNVAILLARLLWIGIWALGIAVILYVFDVGLTPLAAFIGVVGLAASLALQQVLQNLVAGVYLLAEHPFNIGDLIAVIGPSGVNHEGTVEDIQMRTTHLRNRHHELILVPNSAIFSGVVTNRTAVGGFVSHISVTFPRSSNPDQVRTQLFSILQKLPGVLGSPGPELHVDKVGKDDWTASLLFWVSQKDASADAVWAIADAFPDATVNEGDGT